MLHSFDDPSFPPSPSSPFVYNQCTHVHTVVLLFSNPSGESTLGIIIYTLLFFLGSGVRAHIKFVWLRGGRKQAVSDGLTDRLTD